MLDQNTSTQLKTLLERLESPIELVATLDGSDKSAKIKELVEEIAALSPQVTARFDGNNARAPSFGIAKVGEQPRVFFAGLPMGHEFTSLILALLQTSGYAPKVSGTDARGAWGFRGNHHRRASPLRDEPQRGAPLSGLQCERLGHQIQVRQPLRLSRVPH